MNIKHFQLEHFTQFSDLKIELSSDITIFMGNNGTGKTSILRAVATLLSWLIASIEEEKGTGHPISELDIENNSNGSKITLEICNSQDIPFQWTLVRSSKGKKYEYSTDLKELIDLADHYRTLLTQNDQSSLPLIAYYPVERTVLDIPLKIKTHHNFNQLDGYDNALTQGIDFRRFFEWFRECEDAENENNVQQILKLVQDNPKDEHLNEKISQIQDDKQLATVRHAITVFMSEFSKLRIERKPRLRMTVEKQGNLLDVAQLSQGEKTLMALVGDIARRLAMMNPNLENSLQGEGIILIDEIDLHLHPQWQRGIIQRLRTTFPNCQFLLTTHSPLIISDAKNVQCYLLEEQQLRKVDDLYGLDVNQVLLEVMDTNIRNPVVEKKIARL